MPLAWHHQRGTSSAAHAAARRRDAVRPVAGIHAPASVDRRRAGAAGADRDVARPAHVACCCARRRLVGDRPPGDAQDQGGPGCGRAPLSQGLRPCQRSIGNVSVLQSYNRMAQETRALQQLPCQPDRGAVSGARLVGVGQRAAPAGLDHLDDGRAADRRAAGHARRTAHRRHRGLHRLRHAADRPARPDHGLRQPGVRGARQAGGVLPARGRGSRRASRTACASSAA